MARGLRRTAKDEHLLELLRQSHDTKVLVFATFRNLQGGDEFKSLIFNLWLKSRDAGELPRSFDALGQSLLDAQAEYLQAKQRDDALFGE